MTLKDIIKKISNKKEREGENTMESVGNAYAQKINSIDDNELAEMILDMASDGKYKENFGLIPKNPETPDSKATQFEKRFLEINKTRVTLSHEQATELAKAFFDTLPEELASKGKLILEGKNPNVTITNINPETDDKQSSVNIPDEKNPLLTIKIIDKNTIEYLYDLVHEITHTFDIAGGDNSTRWVLGEVAPLCMERLLDEFLSSIPPEELAKMGIDKQLLERDTLDKKTIKMVSNINSTSRLFSEKIKYPGYEKISRRHEAKFMFAQLCASQFETMDRSTRKEKLAEFIRQVSNDDMTSAFDAFGMTMKKQYSIARKSYVYTMKKEMYKLIDTYEQMPEYQERFGDVEKPKVAPETTPKPKPKPKPKQKETEHD